MTAHSRKGWALSNEGPSGPYFLWQAPKNGAFLVFPVSANYNALLIWVQFALCHRVTGSKTLSQGPKTIPVTL